MNNTQANLEMKADDVQNPEPPL